MSVLINRSDLFYLFIYFLIAWESDKNATFDQTNHLKRLLKKVNESISKEKSGIQIAIDEFSAIERSTVALRKNIVISNKSNVYRNLRFVHLIVSHEGSFSIIDNCSNIIFNPFEQKILCLVFSPMFPGVYQALLCFKFDGFLIGRKLQVLCGNLDILSEVAPSGQYIKANNRRLSEEQIDEIVESDYKPTKQKQNVLPQMALYKISPSTRADISGPGVIFAHIESLLQSIKTSPSSVSEYTQYFTKLLFCEELQAEQDIRQFDMSNVALIKRGTLYELSVPGLAEKRPSVLKGDSVHGIVLDDRRFTYIYKYYLYIIYILINLILCFISPINCYCQQQLLSPLYKFLAVKLIMII